MSDQNYDKVSLLLPMSGANNETSFPDYSLYQSAIAVSGSPKTVTTESKYYGSSGYFDGTAGHVDTSGEAVAVGSGDFTFECWLNAASLADPLGLFFFGTYGSNIGRIQSDILTNGEIGFFAAGGSTTWSVRSAAQLAAGVWYHCAFVRNGGGVSIYIDGVLNGSASITSEPAPSSNLFIGYARTASAHRAWNGHIQDVRLTVGLARYTANFTPPSRLIGQISGTVTDNAGQPAVRKIFAVPRVYPQRVATTDSAADGTYTLQVPATEHSRIVLDDAAGTLYNDIIDRVIPE